MIVDSLYIQQMIALVQVLYHCSVIQISWSIIQKPASLFLHDNVIVLVWGFQPTQKPASHFLFNEFGSIGQA